MANEKAPTATGDCSKSLQGNCSQLLKESVLDACSIHVLSAVRGLQLLLVGLCF